MRAVNGLFRSWADPATAGFFSLGLSESVHCFVGVFSHAER